MQIEWREGLALRSAGAVCSGAQQLTRRVRKPTSARKCLQSGPLRKPEEEICPLTRRTTTDRGEARRVFRMRRVVSCGSGDLRWRTKLHLGSREPLEDHHRGSALGAEPKITGVLGAWRVLLGVLVPGRATESKAARKWRAGDWPGSRSAGCARSLPEARAAGSDAGTHRATESATSVRCCERSRASGK